MGSEQSTNAALGNNTPGGDGTPTRPKSAGPQLQRGYTIAAPTSDSLNNSQLADSSPLASSSSRPVSPPMSVCSDSDLPYISYTNKPIGDSPKHRAKGQKINNKTRATMNLRRQSTSAGAVRKRVSLTSATSSSNATQSSTGTLVVVNKGNVKEIPSIDQDPDMLRLKNIPMFLPVMRGTLSLPALRDPEVLERLQPTHVINMCSRLQVHYNLCATKVAQDQSVVNRKIKDTDQDISGLLGKMVERQKQFATYAEAFSRMRQISQQLGRCNTILNQNLELLETINNRLDVEDRLEPFIWTT